MRKNENRKKPKKRNDCNQEFIEGGKNWLDVGEIGREKEEVVERR